MVDPPLLAIQRDQHATGVHLDGIAARASFVGRRRAAGGELDRPVVQRTGNTIAEYDALGQWSAFVRTAIGQREDSIAIAAEHRDTVGIGADPFDHPCTEAWDILHGTNV